MTLREVLENWVEAYNEKNVEKLVEMYSDDAVNYQVANEPVIGKESIKQMFTIQFSSIKTHCIIENIFEQGEWAVMEWKDPLGFMGCSCFHISNGKIKLQRGYWDKISFFKIHNLPLPSS